MVLLVLLFVISISTSTAKHTKASFSPNGFEQSVAPKRCKITAPVHSHNVRKFENCTEVDGFIEINGLVSQTLQLKPEDQFGNITTSPPLDLQLLNLMQNVRKVSQYVVIKETRGAFLPDLAFLRNLEVIEGRVKTSHFEDTNISLMIYSTGLESLDLVNLREVRSGKVLFRFNTLLCYGFNIPFGDIAKDGFITEAKSFIDNFADYCANPFHDRVCERSCKQELGCWGPGRDKCYRPKLNVTVENCFSYKNLFQMSATKCGRCHKKCLYGCSGLGADNCFPCENYQENGTCVEKCSSNSYADAHTICLPCADTCDSREWNSGDPINGCTGPSNMVGPGGCNRCTHAVLFPNATFACVTEKTLFSSECDVNEEGRKYLVNRSLELIYCKLRPLETILVT